jgi:HEPN domain-containing protein
MSEKADLVNGWLAKAESDLAAAQQLIANGPFDIVCFHAQQAIEKLLQGLLAYYDQPPPRTHDLEELQRLILAISDNPGLAALALFEASDYAVMARYDLQFWPDEETASDALALANSVKRVVLRTVTAAINNQVEVGDSSQSDDSNDAESHIE